jgi:hypothetical protein
VKTPILFLALLLALPAYPKKSQLGRPKLDRDRILAALLTTDFPNNIYYDDGAGDGSLILYKQDEKAEYDIVPDPTVKELVNAGDASLPLLISCIGDARPTRIEFKPARAERFVRVPLGYVCLELTTMLVRTPLPKVAMDSDCSTDGIGVCYHEGYYFRPDVLAAEPAAGTKKMAAVQANWQRLLKENSIRFEYPAEWKTRCKSCERVE